MPAAPSSPPEPTDGTEVRSTGARGRRARSLALAWAVTLCEGLLWGAFAWFVADYWMMLPVRYRVAGLSALVFFGAIGLIRLALFYRRYLRNKRKHETP